MDDPGADRVERGSPQRFLAVLLVISAVIRLAWVFGLENDQVSDSVQYVRLATNLAQNEGYTLNGNPNTFWPPGYPLFLSVFFRLAESQLLGKLVNVVLSVAIVGLTYGVGRSLLNETTALWGALLITFLPSQIADCSLLRTEILSLFLLMLAFYWLVRTRGGPQLAWAIPIGIALGAASLVRPSILLFPGVILIVVLLSGTPWHRAILTVSVACVGMITAIIPWTVRNDRVLDKFVLISTNGGYNLWIGNNPYATGSYLLNVDGKPVHSFAMRQQMLQGKTWDGAEIDSHFKQQGVEYIKSNPIKFVLGAFRRTFYFYALDTDAVNWTFDGLKSGLGETPSVKLAFKIIAQAYYLLVMLLATAGIWLAIRFKRMAAMLSLLLPIVYFSIIHGITVGDSRYHFPIMPFVCLLAGFALSTRWWEPTINPVIANSGEQEES